MPTIQIGVTANSSSAGQTVDFDGSIVNSCTLTNSSGESLQYNSGSGWLTLTTGSSVSIPRFLASSFFVRKTTADSYPRPLSLTFEAQSIELTTAQAFSLQAIIAGYDVQPATWYAGEINSVVTPSITADGDLTSATDQVPLKWLAVVNADDDVTAAQALLNGGPNVIEILPGAQAQQAIYGLDGITRQTITRIYAVCISSSAVPADYTGGAYILSDLETDLADALANMARFDFSSGLGATVVRLVASPVYSTNFAQLAVAAGVIA